MRLCFVHGMRQEDQDAAKLVEVWEKALHKAWKSAGLAAKKYTLCMPFYGLVLHELTEEARRGITNVIVRGEANSGEFNSLEAELIRQMGVKAGISNDEVRAELGQEVVARGVANWQLTQGIARLLQRRVPIFGKFGLGFVHQVDAYLTRPHIQRAVDDLVRPALTGERTVVVAHSLGTIVSYRLLQEAAEKTEPAEIPLYLTLGSPLGIDVVKQHIRPPALGRPKGVQRWLNGTDERDYVALISRLDRRSFSEGIENLSDISNGHDDAHSIVDYLSDPTIARQIHDNL
jgi:hypothetical protein